MSKFNPLGQIMFYDPSTGQEVPVGKVVNCRCTLAYEPRSKPQVDPALVIEAIEYTYHARCRRV